MISLWCTVVIFPIFWLAHSSALSFHFEVQEVKCRVISKRHCLSQVEEIIIIISSKLDYCPVAAGIFKNRQYLLLNLVFRVNSIMLSDSTNQWHWWTDIISKVEVPETTKQGKRYLCHRVADFGQICLTLCAWSVAAVENQIWSLINWNGTEFYFIFFVIVTSETRPALLFAVMLDIIIHLCSVCDGLGSGSVFQLFVSFFSDLLPFYS